MEKERCLVVEAMEKCNCDFCKLMKEMRNLSLKYWIEQQKREIIERSLKCQTE
ncbi:MAG: hypothetical protein M0R17_05835 [Candidatus Omnitrophica bacterium]|jgi:hypothetical protein|nr:hypothetical protein [Candidatus Omnitrophota bacterium]